MVDREQLSKEFIQKNLNLKASELYNQAKALGIAPRKTTFLKLVREGKNLPEPTIAKKERSIPIKHRTIKQKASIKARKPAKPKVKPSVKKKTIQLKLPVKPLKIPFEQTKFGKMVKTTMDKHGLSEKKAIKRVRALLKIPQEDYNKLNQIDQDILTQYGY